MTPLAPISMQEMKLSSGNLLDHPSFQGKRLNLTQSSKLLFIFLKIISTSTLHFSYKIENLDNKLHSIYHIPLENKNTKVLCSLKCRPKFSVLIIFCFVFIIVLFFKFIYFMVYFRFFCFISF